jgi:hypothetical protein
MSEGNTPMTRDTCQARLDEIEEMIDEVTEEEFRKLLIEAAILRGFMGGWDANDRGGRRLYDLLTLFDSRNGTTIADLVRSAREGYERSHPDMNESAPWYEFDSIWETLSSQERLDYAKRIFEPRGFGSKPL